MAKEVVRRSKPEEYLERIIASTDSADNVIKRWAREELMKVRKGDYQEDESWGLGVPAIAEKRYGLLRPPVNISVDKPEVFAERVIDAHLDSREYLGYGGITITAEVHSVGSASGSTTYEFSAGFREMVGPGEGDVYATKLVFEYQHPHENGSFDEPEFVAEQLGGLVDLLRGKIELAADELFVVKGTLVVGRKKRAEE